MADIVMLPKRSGTYASIVAGNIRAEAARRGVNQVGLARILGISQGNAWTRWHGRKPYNVEELELIADAFGVEPELLTARPKGLEPPTF